MPAVFDDPTAQPVYRTSGEPPYATPYSSLPPSISPRRVTLRDRITTATLIPFNSPNAVPLSLLSYLCSQMNREIEKGDTYPMTMPMEIDLFGPYWFANFAAVMLLGDWGADLDELNQRLLSEDNVERDWEKACLGSFYIKPNYPGRSSHVCNGGFLVTDGARNRGVGRLMGEGYLEWAPKLGYTYSVFNLVYETNVASCRIWDALGFKRIGRVKGCGNLKSYDYPVDALIYGRELNSNNLDDFITDERFDKIKFYLSHQKYPDGADRAEKSRLRSAATHYRLVMEDNEEKLFLKDKEVVSDPQKQYEVARQVHLTHHGGINKTTASIAEKYHWVRIKETATLVIKNCPECFDPLHLGIPGAPNGYPPGYPSTSSQQQQQQQHNQIMSMPALGGNTPNPNQHPTDPQPNMTDPISVSAVISNVNTVDHLSSAGNLPPLGPLAPPPPPPRHHHHHHHLVHHHHHQQLHLHDPHHHQHMAMPSDLAAMPPTMSDYQVPVDPRIMTGIDGYQEYLQATTSDEASMDDGHGGPGGETAVNDVVHGGDHIADVGGNGSGGGSVIDATAAAAAAAAAGDGTEDEDLLSGQLMEAGFGERV